MKAKKILAAVVSASLSAGTAFAPSGMSVFADEYKGGGDASAAAVKPVLTINVDGTEHGKVFDKSVAGKKVKFSVKVSGAKMSYASTGLHIRYHKDLVIAKDDDGFEMIEEGGALKKLSCGDPEFDPTASMDNSDMTGYFVCTAGKGDYGLDGDMWEFTVIVPPDAKVGDVYPIDIVYKNTLGAQDLFENVAKNTDGLNMQAYTFTQGIFNEYENKNFKASADDIAKCPALADIDKSYDGYIAIADKAPVTTTTRATTTRTTTVTTTTTTKSASSSFFNITKDSIICNDTVEYLSVSSSHEIKYEVSDDVKSIKWFSDDAHILVDDNGKFRFSPKGYVGRIEGTIYGIATFKDGSTISDSVFVELPYGAVTTQVVTQPYTMPAATTKTTTTTTTKPKKSAASIAQFSSCPETFEIGDKASKMETVIECSEGDFTYDITFDDSDIRLTKSYKESAGTKHKITAYAESSNKTERYAKGTLTIRPNNAYDSISKEFTVYVKPSDAAETTPAETAPTPAVSTKASPQPPRADKGAYVYVGDTLKVEGAKDGDYGTVSVTDGVVTPKKFGWSMIKTDSGEMLITVPEPKVVVFANGSEVKEQEDIPYTKGMEIKYELKNYHHSKENVPAGLLYDSSDDKRSTQKWDSIAGYKNFHYDSKTETMTYTMTVEPSKLDTLVGSDEIIGRLKLKAPKMPDDITDMCDPEIKLYKTGGKWYVNISAPQSPAPFYGDANLDGRVSIADSVAILQFIGNKDKYAMTSEAVDNADVFNTGDGLTAKDALTLQKYDSKLLEKLPE